MHGDHCRNYAMMFLPIRGSDAQCIDFACFSDSSLFAEKFGSSSSESPIPFPMFPVVIACAL